MTLETITLFLCGDVMTGRAIDQILPHPGNPALHETHVRSAAGYVRLAERANGPIPRAVTGAEIWGDALDELKRTAPDARIINLETAITTSDDFQQWKALHYRTHPGNIACFTAANIDVCALANNHVLDWGRAGLEETLLTLEEANLPFAGAGRSVQQAQTPASVKIKGKGRVLVWSCGLPSCGIPRDWAAGENTPGVFLLEDLSLTAVHTLRDLIAAERRDGDIVVLSLHWGGNWGYELAQGERDFAHRLIDEAGVDVVHGHSSHHVRGIEVYHGRLILYGCGDFLNDYEGIPGFEDFRGDLALMYFPAVSAATGELVSLRMVPMQIRTFRLNRTSTDDATRLAIVLNREGERLGNRVVRDRENDLHLKWQ